MHPLGYVFVVFGAILTIVGIVLFAKMGTQGTSVVKMMGFEFQLGGSALVIVVVGVALMLVPVLYGDKLPAVVPASSPLTPDASEVTRAQPLSSAQRYLLLGSAGNVVLGESFPSRADCLQRLSEVRGRHSRGCVSTPDQVSCTRRPDGEWICYADAGDCTTQTDLDERIDEARATVKCARVSFTEARQLVARERNLSPPRQ